MDILRFLFSFKGRATRLHYWLATAPALILSIAATVMPLDLDTQIDVVLPATLILGWPALVVGVRRCHDRDHSGWYQLIGVVPLLGSLWLMMDLGLCRGTSGPNRFGADPLPRPVLDI